MTTITPTTIGRGCADCAANTVGAAYSRNIDGAERSGCPVVSVELSLPGVPAEFQLNGFSSERVCAMSNELNNSAVSSDVADNAELTTQIENVGGIEQQEAADKSAVAKCTKFVDYDKLYTSDNVRGSQDVKLPQIVASLRKNGFKPNHPLVVSKKPDGRFLILCGNRRFGGLEFIRTNHADDFGRIVSKGRVPCIVHEGLTDGEEIIIRNDHSKDEDRVELGDWGQFLAVKQLLRVFPGDSEARIAEKMGIMSTKGKNKGLPNRAAVQPRVNLARLPQFVQDEYRKLWDNPNGTELTAFRVQDIKALYAAFRAEYAAYPDGNGPALRAEFDRIAKGKETKASTDSANGNGPKNLSVDDATNRSMGCVSPLVKRILLAATNQGGVLAELDAQAVTLETDSAILADIRAYMGVDDFNDLVIAARNAAKSAQPEQATATV